MKFAIVEQAVRVVAASLFMLSGGVTYAETLHIAGTGVALGGMRILGDEFEQRHPGTTIEVLPSLGSSGGVKALLAGAIDLSVTSRELKDEEKSGGAYAQLYATTPLAFVTSIETNANAITTNELAMMYAGTTQNWPSGERVRVILRPVSETDTQVLYSLSNDMAHSVELALERPGLVIAINDQDNAETLENLSGSLGVVALGQIATEGRRLKVLIHDGVMPKAGVPDTRGEQFTKGLYLVRSSATSQSVDDFVAFVFSPEGQAILVSHNHSAVR